MTTGPHLNHSQVSISLKTPHVERRQLVKALVVLVIFKTFTTTPNNSLKHDVTRSLLEFWIIQTFSLHYDQTDRHLLRESGRVALLVDVHHSRDMTPLSRRTLIKKNIKIFNH